MIATFRIDKYDGYFVTSHYNRHEDNAYVEETLPVILHRAISREKHSIYRSFNQWRTAILSSFGYNPLKCECGTTMLFLELYRELSAYTIFSIYKWDFLLNNKHKGQCIERVFKS